MVFFEYDWIYLSNGGISIANVYNSMCVLWTYFTFVIIYNTKIEQHQFIRTNNIDEKKEENKINILKN